MAASVYHLSFLSSCDPCAWSRLEGLTIPFFLPKWIHLDVVGGLTPSTNGNQAIHI
jgi:hypothetical protein